MAGKPKDQGDQAVLRHIKQPVEEKHKLYNQGKLGEQDRSRLDRIQVEPDQCWDLLRERRARRGFGQDTLPNSG